MANYAVRKNILLMEISDPVKRICAWSILEEHYPEVITHEAVLDPWPIVWTDGILRWKPDPMIEALCWAPTGRITPQMTMAEARERHAQAPLDLKRLEVSRAHGTYSDLDYIRLHKRLGYSLSGYFDVVGAKAWYERLCATVISPS